MRRGAPPVALADLFPRRVAVRALELVLEHFNLREAAVKVNPDEPHQALPGPGDGEIRLFADGWDRGERPVARVFLRGTRARVVVPVARDVVRRQHRKDLRLEDLGLRREEGTPDLDMEVDLADVLEEFGDAMRSAPQRAVPRPRRAGRHKAYRGVLGSVRR